MRKSGSYYLTPDEFISFRTKDSENGAAIKRGTRVKGGAAEEWEIERLTTRELSSDIYGSAGELLEHCGVKAKGVYTQVYANKNFILGTDTSIESEVFNKGRHVLSYRTDPAKPVEDMLDKVMLRRSVTLYDSGGNVDREWIEWYDRDGVRVSTYGAKIKDGKSQGFFEGYRWFNVSFYDDNGDLDRVSLRWKNPSLPENERRSTKIKGIILAEELMKRITDGERDAWRKMGISEKTPLQVSTTTNSWNGATFTEYKIVGDLFGQPIYIQYSPLGERMVAVTRDDRGSNTLSYLHIDDGSVYKFKYRGKRPAKKYTKVEITPIYNGKRQEASKSTINVSDDSPFDIPIREFINNRWRAGYYQADDSGKIRFAYLDHITGRRIKESVPEKMTTLARWDNGSYFSLPAEVQKALADRSVGILPENVKGVVDGIYSDKTTCSLFEKAIVKKLEGIGVIDIDKMIETAKRLGIHDASTVTRAQMYAILEEMRVTTSTPFEPELTTVFPKEIQELVSSISGRDTYTMDDIIQKVIRPSHRLVTCSDDELKARMGLILRANGIEDTAKIDRKGLYHILWGLGLSSSLVREYRIPGATLGNAYITENLGPDGTVIARTVAYKYLGKTPIESMVFDKDWRPAIKYESVFKDGQLVVVNIDGQDYYKVKAIQVDKDGKFTDESSSSYVYFRVGDPKGIKYYEDTPNGMWRTKYTYEPIAGTSDTTTKLEKAELYYIGNNADYPPIRTSLPLADGTIEQIIEEQKAIFDSLGITKEAFTTGRVAEELQRLGIDPNMASFEFSGDTNASVPIWDGVVTYSLRLKGDPTGRAYIQIFEEGDITVNTMFRGSNPVGSIIFGILEGDKYQKVYERVPISNMGLRSVISIDKLLGSDNVTRMGEEMAAFGQVLTKEEISLLNEARMGRMEVARAVTGMPGLSEERFYELYMPGDALGLKRIEFSEDGKYMSLYNYAEGTGKIASVKFFRWSDRNGWQWINTAKSFDGSDRYIKGEALFKGIPEEVISAAKGPRIDLVKKRFEKTKVETRWGYSYEDYRIVGNPYGRRIEFRFGEDGTKTIAVKWFGFYSVKSYKLSTKHNQVMAHYGTEDGSIRADEVFTPRIVESYHENFGRDLWSDLSSIGVSGETLMPRVKETLRIKSGSRESVQFTSSDGPKNYLYILPKDPLGRTLVTQYDNGNLAINLWWLEDTNSTKAPVGVLPASITWDEKKEFKESKNYSESRDISADNVPGSPEGAKRVRVHVYDLKERDRLKRREFFNHTGRLVATEYDKTMVRAANGKWGVATKGTETVYYDASSPFIIPVGGVSAEFGQPGTATKRFTNIAYRPDGSQQIEVQTVDEEEPLTQELTGADPVTAWEKWIASVEKEVAPVIRHDQEYKYKGGDLGTSGKKRASIWSDWLQELKTHWITGGIVMAVLLAGIPIISKIISPITRRLLRKKSIPSSGVPMPIGGGTVGPEEGAVAVLPMQFTGGSYGFPLDVVQNATVLFNSNINAKRAHGESEQDFINEQFVYYKTWLSTVLKNVEGMNVKQGNETQGEVDAEINRTLTADDLYLFYLIYSSGANFSNSCPALISYLFYMSRQMRDAVPGRGGEIGEYVRCQVSNWYGVLARKLGTQTQQQYLIHDDINDLFRTSEFLTDYIRDPNFISQASTKWKTYPDKSGGILGVKGWLSMIRNYYNIIITPFVIAFYVLFYVTGYMSLMPWIAGAVKIIIALAVVYAGLYFWQRVRYKPVRPDEGFKPHSESRRQWIRGSVFLLLVTSAKLIWNFFIFIWLKRSTFNLIGSQWGMDLSIVQWIVGSGILPYGDLMLVGVLWVPFVLFFFLDIFVFFYIGEGIVSHVIGEGLGAYRVQSWAKFKKDFNSGKQEYLRKHIPQSMQAYTPAEKDIIWANAWNNIIDKLYDEDRLTDTERKAYKYNIKGDDPRDFLSGIAGTAPPFSNPPLNKDAQRRLQHFMTSMFMDKPMSPEWDKMKTLTVMTPIFEEEILYSFDEINRRENTGKNKLGTQIENHRDEWINFIDRLSASPTYAGHPEYNSDFAAMRSLRPHQRLVLQHSDLRTEVQDWVAYRFQEFFRTARGVMYQRDAIEFYARITHRRRDIAEIQRMVNEKFQYLVGHQPYKDDAFNVTTHAKYAENHPKVEAIQRILRMYGVRGMELAYLSNEGGVFYSCHATVDASGNIVDQQRIVVPGKQIIGEGKPENQNHMLRFVRGEILQTIDVNQDGYFEEWLNAPNVLEEFNDMEVDIVGVPEHIYTADFGWVARVNAFSDRVFVTYVQRFLAWLGIRFHYGHPDYHRVSSIRQKGGVSRPSAVNEDIFAGYDTAFWGRKIIYREYMQVGKAREASFFMATGLFTKFGMGAGQQAMSRYLNRLHTSPNFGYVKSMLHFLGALGFYIKERIVDLGVMAFLVFIVFMGVSGFVGFPKEALFGFLGVMASQAITLSGIYSSIAGSITAFGPASLLGVGLLAGIGKYLIELPLLLPNYSAHVSNQAYGFQKAMKGEAKYVATGRGYVLEHFNPFHVEGPSPLNPAAAGTKDIYEVYRASQLRWSTLGLMAGIYGIIIWLNPALIWSILFILKPFFTYIMPFIVANRGATPLDIGVRTWARLMFTGGVVEVRGQQMRFEGDWVQWFRKVRSINPLRHPFFFLGVSVFGLITMVLITLVGIISVIPSMLLWKGLGENEDQLQPAPHPYPAVVEKEKAKEELARRDPARMFRDVEGTLKVKMVGGEPKIEFVSSNGEQLYDDERENLEQAIALLKEYYRAELVEGVEVKFSYNLDEVARHIAPVVEVNRYLLNNPPRNAESQAERRLFLAGVLWHELWHRTHSTESEAQAEEATIEYFRANPQILSATIRVLSEDTVNYVHGQEWLEKLMRVRASEAEEEIKATNEIIAKQYGITNIGSITQLSGGVINFPKPIKIDIGNKSYVFKKISADKPKAEYIVAMMRHLKNHGIPVPEIMKTKQGEDFVVINGEYFVLEEFLDGIEISEAELTERYYKEIGGMAARIHNALEDFNPPQARTWKSKEQIAEEVNVEMEKYYKQLQNRKEKGEKLNEVEELFYDNYGLMFEQIDVFLKNSRELASRGNVAISHIHNDLLASNMRFDQDGKIIGIFDFDFAMKAYRVDEFDNMLLGRKDIGMGYDFNKLREIVKSYQETVKRKLSEDELKTIIEIVRLRFLEQFYRYFVRKTSLYSVFNRPSMLPAVRDNISTFKDFVTYFNNKDNVTEFINYINRPKEIDQKVQTAAELAIKAIDDLLAKQAGTLSKQDVLNGAIEADISDSAVRKLLEELRAAVVKDPKNASSVLHILGKKDLSEAITEAMDIVPVEGVALNIIDAEAFRGMDKGQMEQLFKTINTHTEKSKVAIVGFTSDDAEINNILEIAGNNGITIVREFELAAGTPENIANAKAALKYGRMKFDSISVLTSMTNVQRWSYAESIRYIISAKSLTNLGLLNAYNGLPEDIRKALAQSGITAETITHSQIRSTDAEPATYILEQYKQKQAVIEVAA